MFSIPMFVIFGPQVSFAYAASLQRVFSLSTELCTGCQRRVFLCLLRYTFRALARSRKSCFFHKSSCCERKEGNNFNPGCSCFFHKSQVLFNPGILPWDSKRRVHVLPPARGAAPASLAVLSSSGALFAPRPPAGYRSAQGVRSRLRVGFFRTALHCGVCKVQPLFSPNRRFRCRRKLNPSRNQVR